MPKRPLDADYNVKSSEGKGSFIEMLRSQKTDIRPVLGESLVAAYKKWRNWADPKVNKI